MDILCEKCVHNNVCKFKKDFETISYAVNNISITFPGSNSGITNEDITRKLSSIDWVEPLKPRCKHHHHV